MLARNNDPVSGATKLQVDIPGSTDAHVSAPYARPGVMASGGGQNELDDPISSVACLIVDWGDCTDALPGSSLSDGQPHAFYHIVYVQSGHDDSPSVESLW